MELLVAITILGIIMVAIGAMIATAFTTTATVGNRLNSSRGPKMVSRYWVPDVESAETVDVGAGTCVSGSLVVALTWHEAPSTIATPDQPEDAGPLRTVTWCYVTGHRNQLVRESDLAGAAMQTTVVVADVDRIPTVTTAGQVVTITVTVPDKSEPNKTLEFRVGAREAVTP